MKERIKDIFTRPKEEMARTVKWFFALPLCYITFLVVMLFVPTTKIQFIDGTARYLFLILSLVFISKVFLKFEFRKFFSFSGKFRTALFLKGLGAMFVSGLVTTFIWKIVKPQDFVFVLDKENLIATWAGTVVYITIAAIFEELYFRSYIINFRDVSVSQDFSVKDTIKFCLISGLLFTLAHFANPEIKDEFIISSIFYFMMGFAFMFATIKTKGIEASLGMHLANNLLSGLVFGYDNSVIKTNPVFIQHNSISILLLVQMAICLLCCYLALKDN